MLMSSLLYENDPLNPISANTSVVTVTSKSDMETDKPDRINCDQPRASFLRLLAGTVLIFDTAAGFQARFAKQIYLAIYSDASHRRLLHLIATTKHYRIRMSNHVGALLSNARDLHAIIMFAQLQLRSQRLLSLVQHRNFVREMVAKGATGHDKLA